jgi:hypothetical protein
VRKSLSSSLLEVMRLTDMALEANQILFSDVLLHYSRDIDEVRSKLRPHLCKVVSLYPPEQ